MAVRVVVTVALVFLMCSTQSPMACANDSYVVFVDPGEDDQYLPAARAMAALHDAQIKPFDPHNLDPTLGELRESPPKFVVFVLPPEKIDVDLCHEILAIAAQVDEDPFVDFEYGFITGRNGEAARRYVQRIAAAQKRRLGNRAAMFASWEGTFAPPKTPLSAFRAMGFEADDYYVKTRDKEAKRRKETKEALACLRERSALSFFSHGYPDEMGSCFRADDLRKWKVDLSPAILVNCACWNGAPGRWYAPGPRGPVDRGIVDPDASVALQILDSGVSGYIAGVDPWHGPLAMQVFCMIVDDGLRLGEATKRMFDRLAIAFLPGPVAFQPTLENKSRFSGEGANNRRHNGAGMIFYGDPAWAPFSGNAKRLMPTKLAYDKDGAATIRMEVKPLINGVPGQDFMLPMNRLLNYYSVKTAEFMKELEMELYRVVPLQDNHGDAPRFEVISSLCNGKPVETGDPQFFIEKTPRRDYLHVRVPIRVPFFPAAVWPKMIATYGMTVELGGEI